MLKRKKEWFILLCVLAVFLAVPCVKTEAAPAKKKAVKAYKEFLAKEKISWDENWEVPADECKFAIVYIDKDDVPELVLYIIPPHMRAALAESSLTKTAR